MTEKVNNLTGEIMVYVIYKFPVVIENNDTLANMLAEVTEKFAAHQEIEGFESIEIQSRIAVAE